MRFSRMPWHSLAHSQYMAGVAMPSRARVKPPMPVKRSRDLRGAGACAGAEAEAEVEAFADSRGAATPLESTEEEAPDFAPVFAPVFARMLYLLQKANQNFCTQQTHAYHLDCVL
jgi:hypothetical protein